MSTHVFDVLDVEEVVGGDPSPGVGLVVVSQPVLELGLLSPDLLMGPLGAPGLAEQSAHVYKLLMPRLCHTAQWSLMSASMLCWS